VVERNTFLDVVCPAEEDGDEHAGQPGVLLRSKTAPAATQEKEEPALTRSSTPCATPPGSPELPDILPAPALSGYQDSPRGCDGHWAAFDGEAAYHAEAVDAPRNAGMPGVPGMPGATMPGMLGMPGATMPGMPGPILLGEWSSAEVFPYVVEQPWLVSGIGGHQLAFAQVPVALPVASAWGNAFVPIDQQDAFVPVDQQEDLPASAASHALGSVPVPATTTRASVPNATRQNTVTLSESPGKRHVHWTVDARKLRSNDKQAVSPSFQLHEGEFKIVMHPKPMSGSRRGANFKTANGKGYLNLKCETDLLGASTRLAFSIVIGNMRQGPFTHDYGANAMVEECGKLEWDFTEAVDADSQTLVVELVIDVSEA
jgi:hypothetical protein